MITKMLVKQCNGVEIFCDLFSGFPAIICHTLFYIETFPAVASAVKGMEHSAQPVHRLHLPDAYTHWIMTSHGVVCLVFAVKVVNLFIPAYAKF